MAIFTQLAPLIEQVQSQLQATVHNSFPASLREPILYFLEAPGKKIRPLLTLLTCQSSGGQISQAMPAALGIELFHDFTLIHDDIMDRDDLRRGRYTIHKKWGEDAAILVGDLLLGLAYERMLQCDERHLPRVLKLFTEALVKVCEGQALDKEFERHPQVSLEDYLDMISKKTAWLFKLSTQLGALLADAPAPEIEAMEQFGLNLGIGFQIQDDWLDYVGEEDTLGKKVGSDLKLDKKTYVTLSYLKLMKENPDLRKKYPARLSDYRSLTQLKNDLFQLGIAENIGKQIDRYINDALNNLQRVQPLEESNKLYQIVLNLQKRQS